VIHAFETANKEYAMNAEATGATAIDISKTGAIGDGKRRTEISFGRLNLVSSLEDDDERRFSQFSCQERLP
jgi:hypothetical protein